MRPTPTARSPLVALILAAAVATGGVGGCQRTDPVQQAIDNASSKLENLSVAGANAVSNIKERKTELSRIASELATHASGNDDRAATASLLVARARSGLGEIAAKDAVDVEGQFMAKTSVGLALLNQWVSQHTTAAALSRYDPSKDLAELDRVIAERNDEAAKLERDKATQVQAISEIQSRVQQARAQAKSQRDAEGAVRAQMEGKSQTERETLLRQAADLSRAADALERQAAELDAESAQQAPKVVEIESQIARVRTQVDSLRAAKQAIQQRADAARQQSQTATADTVPVGKAIADTLTDLAALRTSAAAPTEEARKQYTQAVSAAKKLPQTASKETRTAANAAAGAYQQSLGDVLATKSRSVKLYAATLGAMADAQPPIPGAGDLAAKATAAQNEYDSTTKEAESAYEEAKGFYSKAGGSGALADKLKAVTDALDKLKDERNKPIESPKPAAPAAPAPGSEPPVPAPGTPAAAVPATPLTDEQKQAVEAAARDVLKKISDAVAAGDLAALRDLMLIESEAARSVFDATMPLGFAAAKIDKASQAKFNKDLRTLLEESQAPAVTNNPMIRMAGPMLAGASKNASILSADNVAQAAITVIALDKADASIPGDDDPTHIVKHGEAWKIQAGKELESMAAGMGPMLGMLKGVADALSAVADDINADKFATPDEMLTALSARITGAAGGMGPGNGKPRPRPAPDDNNPPPPPGGGG